MGYPCYQGLGKRADLVASDAIILPGGGYRPAEVAEDPTLPHKCWNMDHANEQHVCWLDGSVHPKEKPYPGIVQANQTLQAGGEENEEEGRAGPATGVGQDMTLNHRMKMDTFFRKGVFKVDDEWRFSFTFNTKFGNVLVEKDAIVAGLGYLHGQVRRYPNFRYAPGHHKTRGPGTGPDLVLNSCSGPQEFVKTMMDAYGPIPGKTRGTRGKAWNSIRLFRNGQDLGTLREIRAAYNPTRIY